MIVAPFVSVVSVFCELFCVLSVVLLTLETSGVCAGAVVGVVVTVGRSVATAAVGCGGTGSAVLTGAGSDVCTGSAVGLSVTTLFSFFTNITQSSSIVTDVTGAPASHVPSSFCTPE